MLIPQGRDQQHIYKNIFQQVVNNTGIFQYMK